MVDRSSLNRARSVFAGYDKGVHTLPDALVDARTRLDAIDAQRQQLAEPPDASEALREAGNAVADGHEIDTSRVVEARRAAEQYLDTFQVLDAARDIAADRLVAVVYEHADAIVKDHIGPALLAVVADVAKTHAAYAEHGESPQAILTAPKAARDAYLRMNDLEARYLLLRSAASGVRIATGTAPREDTQGLFAIVKNTDALHPQYVFAHRNMPGSNVPPWPTESTREYLLYLARPDVEVWCPTGAEQDARWWEVFGQQVDKQRDAVFAMRGFDALGPAPDARGLGGVPQSGGIG